MLVRYLQVCKYASIHLHPSIPSALPSNPLLSLIQSSAMHCAYVTYFPPRLARLFRSSALAPPCTVLHARFCRLQLLACVLAGPFSTRREAAFPHRPSLPLTNSLSMPRSSR